MLPFGLVSVLIWIVLCIPIGLFVPFYGALVRVRANFQLKGIQLSSEDGRTSSTGSYGYFTMLKRMRRIEGWRGMLKGHVPISLQLLTFCFYAVLAWDSSNVESTKAGIVKIVYRPHGFLRVLINHAAVTLLAFPFHILTIRAMVTPYVLSYYQPRLAFRVLLSSTERRRPWLLFFIPGLFMTLLLQTAVAFVRSSFFTLLLRTISYPQQFSIFTLIFSTVTWAIFTVGLVPLDVMFIRLALQRHQGQSSYEYVIPEVHDQDLTDNEPQSYSQDGEDVIELRTDLQPYTSFIDCGKNIYREEGWRTFFRCYWATVLSGLSHALMP